MLRSKFYQNSPVVFQDILLTCRGILYKFLREGKTFKRIYSNLESMECLAPREIERWQNKKLTFLVWYCYENIPYYNKLFKRLGIKPSDIRNAEDLKKLPFLTKEDIRKAPEEFLPAKKRNAFVTKNFTSGTSGKPLMLYRDLYSINFENAVLWRQRRWAGLSLPDRIAVLREGEIVPFGAKRPPFWRYSLAEKKMFLSAYHLSEKTAPYYVKALQDFRPAGLEAEPSLLYVLAMFIKRQGIPTASFSIKAILTSSEMLLDAQRSLIEEVFKARIYDFYGNSERVTAIGMCERGNYHLIPEYSITEFLALEGESEKKEIVGTNLHNYAMPLLRYRTGDVAEVSEAGCDCRRSFKTIKRIYGRLSDFLVSRDGRISTEACYLTLKGVGNIVQSQIIQEDMDTIRMRYVPAENFSEGDAKKIVDNIKSYMGPDVKVLLEEDNRLVENKAAKFRPFISKVGAIK